MKTGTGSTEGRALQLSPLEAGSLVGSAGVTAVLRVKPVAAIKRGPVPSKDVMTIYFYKNERYWDKWKLRLSRNRCVLITPWFFWEVW